MTKKMPLNRPRVSQCVAAVVMTVTSFCAFAATDLEQNLSAVEAFSARTESLIEEAQENGDAYSLLVEEVGDVMARTQSAKAAMQTVDLSNWQPLRVAMRRWVTSTSLNTRHLSVHWHLILPVTVPNLWWNLIRKSKSFAIQLTPSLH